MIFGLTEARCGSVLQKAGMSRSDGDLTPAKPSVAMDFPWTHSGSTSVHCERTMKTFVPWDTEVLPVAVFWKVLLGTQSIRTSDLLQ